MTNDDTMRRSLQLLLAAVIGLTAILPDWISIWVGRHDISAGLWGTSVARWDDMRVDLDIFGVAYLAFAITVVGVIMLVRAGLSGDIPSRMAAKKALLATAIAQGVFLVRMLIENGVGLNWAGVVGPAAVIAALVSLRKN
jgi:hypothetical protein